jgi:hypothetical protein
MYARGRITTRAGSLNNIPTRPGNPIPTPAKIFLCMENNLYSPVFIHFKLHTEVKGRFFSINRKASLNKRRTQTVRFLDSKKKAGRERKLSYILELRVESVKSTAATWSPESCLSMLSHALIRMQSRNKFTIGIP